MAQDTAAANLAVPQTWGEAGRGWEAGARAALGVGVEAGVGGSPLLVRAAEPRGQMRGLVLGVVHQLDPPQALARGQGRPVGQVRGLQGKVVWGQGRGREQEWAGERPRALAPALGWGQLERGLGQAPGLAAAGQEETRAGQRLGRRPGQAAGCLQLARVRVLGRAVGQAAGRL